MGGHFVVAGGGQAAVQAIDTARRAGFDGRITLIGDEPFLPYQRPPLSKKYLAGEIERERLSLKPESFYPSRDVEVLTGIRVVELGLGRRTVETDDGRSLAYDRLLLATGGRPRRIDVPGAELDGVHYLRSIADVDSLAPRLGPGARLVIVGAGYIGLEVAAVAAVRGVHVTVLEAAERVMARVVCPETAALFAARHAAAGVDVRCGATVTAFRGAERIGAVETADGDLVTCDVALVAIGIVPNVELATQAGLDCTNGILVDGFARTAAEGVSAAGDCTRHRHPIVGAEIRLESVHNALEQGKAAGFDAAADPRAFEDVPWFWSDQYELKLQIAGVALDYDSVVVRGDGAEQGFAAYYLAGGHVIAVDAVNRPRDFLAAKKLVARHARVPRELLADADADLSAYGV
jgi:3-phenylpropionate/trans-cinnamate dioxygenase ferredoxin reductase subunit